MFTILRALHTMGQHEPNYIALIQLAVLAYELLRARHACIVEILAQVPGCSVEDVKRFDDHVLQVIHGKENGANGQKGSGGGKIVGDRTLKNMFKKLIGQLIGKDVAQMFKVYNFYNKSLFIHFNISNWSLKNVFRLMF